MAIRQIESQCGGARSEDERDSNCYRDKEKNEEEER